MSAGRAAQEKFAESYGEVARLGKAVPPNDQSPSLLYQLQTAADKHGVAFNELEVKTNGWQRRYRGARRRAARRPLPPWPRPARPSAPPASRRCRSTSTSRATSSTSSASSPRSSASRRPAATDGIQVRGRLLTVDGLAIAAAARGGFPDVQVSIAATAYVLPPDEGLTAGATASGPAGTAGAPGQTASTGTAAATPTAAGVTK